MGVFVERSSINTPKCFFFREYSLKTQFYGFALITQMFKGLRHLDNFHDELALPKSGYGMSKVPVHPYRCHLTLFLTFVKLRAF